MIGGGEASSCCLVLLFPLFFFMFKYIVLNLSFIFSICVYLNVL